jgi:hypothetical protein
METQLERDSRLLERRVERLELLVVQVVCWAASLALVIGSVLPYMPVEENSGEDVMERLITVGFSGLAWRDGEGNASGFSITAGIGFLGLMICAAAAVGLMFVIGSASASDRTRRAVNAVAALLTIGTAVAGILYLMGVGSDEVSVGPGFPVFVAGVAGFLLLTVSSLRDWWDPSRKSMRLLTLGR